VTSSTAVIQQRVYQQHVHNVDQLEYDERFFVFTLQFPSIFEVLFSHGIAATDLWSDEVFYLTSSRRSARLSLYNRYAGVSGFWGHRLERPASPRRICSVTRGFQTTTLDFSVFTFLPRHYHMTRVLLSPFITRLLSGHLWSLQ